MSVKNFWALFSVLLATVFLGLALADSDTGRGTDIQDLQSEGYVRETTTVAYRETLDGGEGSADLGNAAITAVQELTVTGFPNAQISGRFSVASATCVITVTRWHKDAAGTLTFKSMNTATLTAGATYTIGGDYPSTATVFDTSGCDVIKVLAADPSTGTVDLWAEVF